MRRRTSVVIALVLAGAVAVGMLAAIAVAQSGGSRFSAQRLVGDFEVPAVSTDARGSFRARLINSTTVEYTLKYDDLEGDVRQAHIHFAQPGVNGGISVWLCETDFNAAVPPATPVDLRSVTPDCPGPRDGEVTDTFTAAEVVGPSGQGITAGEFSELLEAMRKGLTYANVHTATPTGFPGGEIRAQIRRGGGGGGGDDDDD